jgi:hypothetical protein
VLEHAIEVVHDANVISVREHGGVTRSVHDANPPRPPGNCGDVSGRRGVIRIVVAVRGDIRETQTESRVVNIRPIRNDSDDVRCDKARRVTRRVASRVDRRVRSAGTARPTTWPPALGARRRAAPSKLRATSRGATGPATRAWLFHASGGFSRAARPAACAVRDRPDRDRATGQTQALRPWRQRLRTLLW